MTMILQNYSLPKPYSTLPLNAVTETNYAVLPTLNNYAKT